MQFYIKNQEGEFAEANQEQIDSNFKERFERFKKTESANIREQVETKVREELTPTLTNELEEKLKQSYEPKLKDAEDKLQKLNIQFRRKTIAAEYGFKTDIESFLGDGTEEDMRAKADLLKKSVSSTPENIPDKKTVNDTHKVGIVTKI